MWFGFCHVWSTTEFDHAVHVYVAVRLVMEHYRSGGRTSAQAILFRVAAPTLGPGSVIQGFDGLTRDGGDEVEVLVDGEDGQPCLLGGRRDQ